MDSAWNAWNATLQTNKFQSYCACVVGVIVTILAFIFFNLCDDWRSSDDSYSSEDVAGFVLGTLFLALGCVLIVCGGILLSFDKNVKALCVLSGLLSVLGIIVLAAMKGFIYIVWNTSDYDESNTSPIETLVSLSGFLICLTLSLLCAILAYRVWFVSNKLSGDEFGFASTNSNNNDTNTTNTNDTDENERKEETPLLNNENVNKNSMLAKPVDLEYDYIPTAYERSIGCNKSDVACFWFVFILMPILFFIVCLLPSSFYYFLPNFISVYASTYGVSEDSGDSSSNWVIYVGDLVIYAEVLVYYVLFVLICSASYLSRKSLWFRIEMRRLNFFPLNIGAVSQAKSLLCGIVIVICVLWFVYFAFIYNYDSSEEWSVSTQSAAGWLIAFARAFGKVGMLLLALLIASVAGKNCDIWQSVFGMSYDKMLSFHKKLSNSFVIVSILHVIFLLIAFGVEGTFWQNIIFSDLPLQYASDNFTVAAIWYLFVFLFVPLVIILSWMSKFSNTNSKYYNVFYYGHVVAGMTFTLVLLWHGTGSWYIVLPSIILYYVDSIIGFYKSTRQCNVKDLSLAKSSNNLIELSISIDEVFGDEKKHNYAKNELFEYGTFVYIKIWQISKFEWRPFRIVSCSAKTGIAKFLIWNENEWTNELHRIASSNSSIDLKNNRNDLNVSLSGPFGEAMIVDSYRKILLICEGSGVTSMIGFFAFMLEKAIADATQVSVDLVFISDEASVFLQFADIFALYAKHFDGNSERLFDVRLFYRDANDERVEQIEQKVGLTLEEGSPDLVKELQYLEGLGTFTLIIVNGSESIIRDSERVAVRFGAHFRSDRNAWM